jgi:uncharacterized protein YhhL (DUF1145 family)
MSDSVSIQIKTILGSILLKFIYCSNRKNVRGRDNYESLIKQGKSVILSVWHGQLLSVVHDLRKEKFYATISIIIGMTIFLLGANFVVLIICLIAGVGLRLIAFYKNWHLPKI